MNINIPATRINAGGGGGITETAQAHATAVAAGTDGSTSGQTNSVHCSATGKPHLAAAGSLRDCTMGRVQGHPVANFNAARCAACGVAPQHDIAVVGLQGAVSSGVGTGANGDIARGSE